LAKIGKATFYLLAYNFIFWLIAEGILFIMFAVQPYTEFGWLFAVWFAHIIGVTLAVIYTMIQMKESKK
jgi:uncharacterized membrane protein HdeD (DUF308 family)